MRAQHTPAVLLSKGELFKGCVRAGDLFTLSGAATAVENCAEVVRKRL